ncbi:MAG TPA: hypothetical protein VFJ23_06575 [Candidatus Nitrosotalea sp.]|nr:hypothetical protein [Candidatus Nitrosotalea sp.]
MQNIAFADNSIRVNPITPSQQGYLPFNVNYSNNPVIITQVELATPLASGYEPAIDCVTYSNGTKICYTLESPYHKDINSPYYNIKCSFYNSHSKCDLIHQFVTLNSTCDVSGVDSQGNQWIEIRNNLNSTLHLTNFGIIPIVNNILSIPGKPLEYVGADYTGNKNFTINPYQSCFIGFSGMPGEDLLFPLNNSSVAISYTYNNTHHMVATPFLTDVYNDSKTWQFDGNKWIFEEQNTVTVPEFPFAILVLIASITSLIIFHRMKLG